MPVTNPDYSTLDYEQLAEEIGLKVKHIPLLIMSFVEESVPIAQSLKSDIERREYREIQAQAHSIKGSAANLRFNELSAMAKEMEHAAADKNISFEYMLYLEAIQKAIESIKV